MAFTHGKSAAFFIADSGATERNISGFHTQASLNRSADTAETSTFGTQDKTYVAGLKDATLPFTGRFDATVDGYLSGVLGTPTTWSYLPQGSASGLVKYSGTAILTRYEPTADLGDAASHTGEFQISGAITRAVL